MKKLIIREVETGNSMLEDFFDDDGIRGAGGNYCYNVFIIASGRNGDVYGIQAEEYKKLVSEWAGVKPEDCTLEMIDGCSTHTTYRYRTA